jgi:hypothetical protein
LCSTQQQIGRQLSLTAVCAVFTVLCAASCSPFMKENPGVQSPCLSPDFRLVHQVCRMCSILKRATDKTLEVGYLYLTACQHFKYPRTEHSPCTYTYIFIENCGLHRLPVLWMTKLDTLDEGANLTLNMERVLTF